MPRSSPVRARLVAHVTTEAEACRRKGNAPLPPIGRMASACKVSYETMWKAVDQCRRQGLLSVTAGGRVRPGPGQAVPDAHVAAPEAAVRPQVHAKWELTRERLRSDIIEGNFAHGKRLPPYKLLSERYGAGFRVLRLALTALCDEGYLETCRGGVRPRTHAPASSGDRIVLLTGVLREGSNQGMAFGRNWDILRALERQCAGARVRLARVLVTGKDLAYRNDLSVGRLRSTRGFIVWTQGIGELDPAELAHEVALTGKPVAVLDESALAPYGFATNPASLVQLFSLGCKPLPGAAVARHLLDLGHRRMAYFSSLGNDARLEGLSRALARAGAPDGVTVFRESLGAGEAERAASDQSLGPVVRGLALARRKRGARTGSDYLLRDLQPYVASALLGTIAAERFADAFSRALADTSLTAWVGCSDIIAVQCLRFLRERGVAVPGSISVVGFDDSTEAAQSDLTSYNFNVEGLASAMVTHLLHPRQRRERRGMGEWFEPTGLVTLRASSASPPTHPSATRDR